MLKQFVRLNLGGVVEQDLEVEAEDWDRRIVPPALREVTGHPQWRGLGSLLGRARLADGSFGPAPAQPLPAPSPLEARVQRIEDLVKRIAAKVGA